MKKFFIALTIALTLTVANFAAAEKIPNTQLRAILTEVLTVPISKPLPLTFAQFKGNFNAMMLSSFADSAKQSSEFANAKKFILLDNVEVLQSGTNKLFVKPFIPGEVVLVGLVDSATDRIKTISYFFSDPQSRKDQTIYGLILLCVFKSVAPNADAGILGTELGNDGIAVRDGVKFNMRRDSQVYILTITAA